LIVDDEAAVLSLTALVLECYGYKVIGVPSPIEAVHLFEVWPDLEVDLMLLDIMMPEMNGIELAARMRSVRPDLPVLYFSAYPNQLLPLMARGTPYIAKPFTSSQLTHKIREVLDNAKGTGKAAPAP